MPSIARPSPGEVVPQDGGDRLAVRLDLRCGRGGLNLSDDRAVVGQCPNQRRGSGLDNECGPGIVEQVAVDERITDHIHPVAVGHAGVDVPVAGEPSTRGDRQQRRRDGRARTAQASADSNRPGEYGRVQQRGNPVEVQTAVGDKRRTAQRFDRAVAGYRTREAERRAGFGTDGAVDGGNGDGEVERRQRPGVEQSAAAHPEFIREDVGTRTVAHAELAEEGHRISFARGQRGVVGQSDHAVVGHHDASGGVDGNGLPAIVQRGGVGEGAAGGDDSLSVGGRVDRIGDGRVASSRIRVVRETEALIADVEAPRRAAVGDAPDVVGVCPGEDRVAEDRHRVTQVIIRRPVGGGQLGRIHRGSGPACRRPGEDIRRAGFRAVVVNAGGPDDDGINGDRD